MLRRPKLTQIPPEEKGKISNWGAMRNQICYEWGRYSPSAQLFHVLTKS